MKDDTSPHTTYLAAAGALFHRRRQKLDFVHSPAKAWMILSIIFVLLFLVVVAGDGWIAYQLHHGTLVAPPPAPPAPGAIISQSLLSQTATLYMNKASALALLGSTTSAIADPATP